jgi:DNA-binding transcriptional LysR family regulator
MELRQLEHFVAVAEERNFTRAAARCHIVQSGLSASVRSLEGELGVDLFARSTRRVELTEAGRALLPEARRALAAAGDAADAVAAVEGLLRGTLAVGIMQSQGPVSLGELIGRFHAAHPAVEIRLRQAGSSALLDLLREGRVELAFASHPDLPRGLERRSLHDEATVVLCAPDHRLAGRRRLRLRDLAGEQFVDYESGWATRTLVDGAFAAAGIERHTACEVNDGPTLVDLVANGLGIAIVPPAVVPPDGGAVQIRLERAPIWSVGIFTRAGGHLSAAARALLEMVPTVAALGTRTKDPDRG